MDYTLVCVTLTLSAAYLNVVLSAGRCPAAQHRLAASNADTHSQHLRRQFQLRQQPCGLVLPLLPSSAAACTPDSAFCKPRPSFLCCKPCPSSRAANPVPPSRAANPAPPSRAANPVPPSRAANPVLPATCPVISRTLLPCPQLQLRHLYKTTTADFCFSTFVANSTAHFISITALQSGVVLPLLPNSACCKPCPSSPTAAVLPAICPVISRVLFTLPATATAPPVKRHNSR